MGAATSPPSFTEDRPTVKIRKDRGKIEVGLGAHSPSVVVRRGQVLSGRKTVVVRKLPPPEVASGMGIHRNDRL